MQNADMMLKYIIAQGELQPEQEEMMRKQQMIQQLRQQSMQMPEMRGNSRIRTASNPLEFIANPLQAYGANQMQSGLDAQSKLLKQKRLGNVRQLEADRITGALPSDDPVTGIGR